MKLALVLSGTAVGLFFTFALGLDADGQREFRSPFPEYPDLGRLAHEDRTVAQAEAELLDAVNHVLMGIVPFSRAVVREKVPTEYPRMLEGYFYGLAYSASGYAPSGVRSSSRDAALLAVFYGLQRGMCDEAAAEDQPALRDKQLVEDAGVVMNAYPLVGGEKEARYLASYLARLSMAALSAPARAKIVEVVLGRLRRQRSATSEDELVPLVILLDSLSVPTDAENLRRRPSYSQLKDIFDKGRKPQ